MYKPDVLIIGINGLSGVGKTTLIDRLCVELRDEYEVGVVSDLFIDSDSGPSHHESMDTPRNVVRQASQAQGMAKIVRRRRAIQASGIKAKHTGITTKHLLLVEGNGRSYEQWMSGGLVSELIHVVDLNQNYQHDWPEDGFVKKAGLLVINKLDLLELTTPEFASITLQTQATRGFNPSIYSSMHTGFGLDLLVVHIKHRIVTRRIKQRYKSD